jgi:hypothetical protein
MFSLSFTYEHKLTYTYSSNEKTYFAFTYPFSYVDICDKLVKIEEKLKETDYDYIYYHKELLGRSIEERGVDLVTLTSKMGMLGEKEELLENCFPEHGDDQSKRPFKFNNKKVVFLTARVHPGETPASFVLNGILDLLTNKNKEQGRILLDKFVFKIIP